MTPTLKDVAELAGVSRSAVSRTFTAGASVSDKTRRKVEKAAAELGYHPNALASSLTTGRTKLIGLISNNFSNPLFMEVFDLFTRGLQERGLRPLLVNLSEDDAPEDTIRLLRQYSVDGAILASSTLPLEFPRALQAANIPVVHSFGRHDSAMPGNVVGIDNVECGRIAATTLLARGYDHIGFLGGPEAATSTQDRLKGFSEVIAAHPATRLTTTFASAYSFDAGRVEMTKQLMTDRAEVYFCGDDVLSIGALSAAQSAGLRVPEDVGIIGLNDMEMARWENIALTTIRQPIAEIIETSIDVVEAQLDEPDRMPETRIFPCRLVERNTLRPLPQPA